MSHDNDSNLTRVLTDAPVPDHAPGFWDNLEAQMAAEDGEVTPLNRRRVGWARVLPIAAAVAALLGALAIARNGSDASRVQADQPGAATTFAGGTTDPTTVQGVATAATQVARQFVDNMASGNIEGAKSLLGPRSEAYLTATTGSVDQFLRDASPDYATRAHVVDLTTTALRTGVNEYVVVLDSKSPTGNPERHLDAIPVVKAESAGAWFVEPWALDPNGDSRIELLSPNPAGNPPTLSAGDTVRVIVPAAGQVWFGFGSDELAMRSVVGTARDARADWPHESATGERVLIVIYKTDTIFTALARVVALTAS